MQIVEPERDIVRRAAPWGVPAAALAFAIGALAGGWSTGLSAALGVAVVFGNFAVNGLALARAARISVTALFAVATIGFFVRMAVILAIMFALNQLAWFSPAAFAAGLAPSLILLLAYEAKLISGPIGQQWQIPEEEAA